MSQTAVFLFHAAVIGIGATAFMDLWAFLQNRLFGAPMLDYAMVGRWLGHLLRGCFTHSSITAAEPIAGEETVGWIAHYAIGIAFAGMLLAIWGLDWAHNPSIVPALSVGLSTVAAPFLILQPAFGAGIAASRTPRPNAARARSLIAHLAFGIGLYVAAEASASIWVV